MRCTYGNHAFRPPRQYSLTMKGRMLSKLRMMYVKSERRVKLSWLNQP